MYNHNFAGYPEPKISSFAEESGGIDSRVYCLVGLLALHFRNHAANISEIPTFGKSMPICERRTP